LLSRAIDNIAGKLLDQEEAHRELVG
jgi:hypothetical protein